MNSRAIPSRSKRPNSGKILKNSTSLWQKSWKRYGGRYGDNRPCMHTKEYGGKCRKCENMCENANRSQKRATAVLQTDKVMHQNWKESLVREVDTHAPIAGESS